RVAPGVGVPRRHGTGALEAKRRSRLFLENLAAVFKTFFARAAAQNDSEFSLHAGIYLRTLGWNRVRARCGHYFGGSCWQNWRAGGSTGFARDHACFLRYDSGLLRNALARGETRSPRCARFLFCANANIYRAHVWKSVLSQA